MKIAVLKCAHRLKSKLSPLIDMVFILLIFFIVTTVFVDERGFETAQSRPAQELQEEKEPLSSSAPTGGSNIRDALLVLPEWPHRFATKWAVAINLSSFKLRPEPSQALLFRPWIVHVALGPTSSIFPRHSDEASCLQSYF